jgi:hypothetical protein
MALVVHNEVFQPPGHRPETETKKAVIPGRLESFVKRFRFHVLNFGHWL